MRFLKLIACVLGVAASLAYLLNPSAGLFEILPDYLPIVGHLDEAAAVGLLLASFRGFRRLRGSRAATGEQATQAAPSPPAAD